MHQMGLLFWSTVTVQNCKRCWNIILVMKKSDKNESNLPTQGPLVHSTVSKADPGQSNPPPEGGGLSQVLVLFSFPGPHWASQREEIQSDHPPSTAWERQWIFSNWNSRTAIASLKAPNIHVYALTHPRCLVIWINGGTGFEVDMSFVFLFFGKCCGRTDV